MPGVGAGQLPKPECVAKNPGRLCVRHGCYMAYKALAGGPRAIERWIVRNGSESNLTASQRHFRSAPNNGHHHAGRVGPFRARNGSRIRQNVLTTRMPQPLVSVK
jgi:hypothetical protein